MAVASATKVRKLYSSPKRLTLHGHDYYSRDCICGNCNAVLYSENRRVGLDSLYAADASLVGLKHCRQCGCELQ